MKMSQVSLFIFGTQESIDPEIIWFILIIMYFHLIEEVHFKMNCCVFHYLLYTYLSQKLPYSDTVCQNKESTDNVR